MVIPVLVVSCDKRDWLWEPWARCWKDNASPYLNDVYLITGEKTPEFDGVAVIPTHTDNWSWSIRAALDAVDSDRVMLTLDDFLPTSGCDLVRWDIIHHSDWPVLGIHPSSNLYRCEPQYIKDFHKFLPSSPYQASLQPTVWDTRVLRSLLMDTEGPWAFEKHGNARLINQGIVRHFLDADWYVHAVRKGEILPEAKHLMGVA